MIFFSPVANSSATKEVLGKERKKEVGEPEWISTGKTRQQDILCNLKKKWEKKLHAIYLFPINPTFIQF